MTTDGLKVFVYLNLHKNLWSIKALEGPMKGRVIDRQAVITLIKASPKVSEKGRARVLLENRKNVHAGIVGYLSPYYKGFSPPWYMDGTRVSYNPHKSGRFMAGKRNWFIYASLVHMDINSNYSKVRAYNPVLYPVQGA